jgi:peptidoglycan/LPS O-acetylase OafA/YrhL
VHHIRALDGLRAIAVIAVLAFHDGRLTGGFLGVDLFFVLSGFLITRLLLDEAENSGSIDLMTFWARRFRRLLPAVLVLLVTVVLFFRFFADTGEWINSRKDAPWAQFYVANWHQIAQESDYWDAFASPSPFSHLWSLAIEEQFYMVWPPLVLIFWRWGRQRAVAWLSLIGVCASAGAMALLIDDLNPTRVYVGTDTRAFSLLIGAFCAVPFVQHWFQKQTYRRPLASQTAVGLVVVFLGAMWVLSSGEDNGLFRGGLLLHAVLCGLLVSLLTYTPGGLSTIFSCAPFVAVGKLSYSLYLWHWPVFVFLSPQRTGFDAATLTALRLVISFALASASYLLIENPIRFHAKWARGSKGFIAFFGGMSVAVATWIAIPIPSTTNAVNIQALSEISSTTTPTSNTSTSVTSNSMSPAAVPPVFAEEVIEGVYFYGDSIASDFWPAVNAAFAASNIPIDTGAFGGVGLIPRDDNPNPISSLEERLIEVNPDLLIVQLSVWDAERSAIEQIDALENLEALAERQALQVFIISFPVIISDRTNPGQKLLEMRARDFTLNTENLIFLDQSPALGSKFSLDIDRDGIPERKRDGVHVCPTGALVFTQWLIGEMTRLYPRISFAATPQWAFGDWMQDEQIGRASCRERV